LKESVIIVDDNGRSIGVAEKLEAHYSGFLHRAFSIFVFNGKGQLLLQQRAADKYHSAGLWTNTCCSHPRLEEATIDAAHRRLKEEMGFDCDLTELFQFTYRHEFENGLIEHEFDHVFLGLSDQLPEPDLVEVADFKYINIDTLINELAEHPEKYTPWLKICVGQVIENYNQINYL